MNTKNVLYAAVGAPVVAARKVGDKVTEIRSKLSEEASGYTEAAEKTIDKWAVEGEKIVSRITEGKVVDEITAKVDLDQAKEQVTKLRDQLEEMLATWRASFRPEKAGDNEEPEPARGPAPKTAAAKPASKAAGASKARSGAAKASAAKTTKSPAAKTSSTKTNPAPAEKAS